MRLICIAVLSAALLVSVAPTFGQCVLNDGSNSAVSLTIGGLDPSDFPGHVVPVVNGQVNADVTGAPGTFFALAAGNLLCGAVPAGPVIDQIDLSAPFVLDVGITPKSYSVALPAGFVGVPAGAVQVVSYDITINRFVATDAARVFALPVTVTTYPNIGDDAFVQHTLSQAGASSITFGGTTYTSLFVGSNGQVTFNAGSGDFSTSAGEFFAGWQLSPTTNANPGVAVYWGDFGRSSAPADPVYVVEDGGSGAVTVLYENQQWWDSQTPAGTFAATFNTNSVTIDLSGALAGVSITDQDPIVGVSDGDDQVGTDSTVDLSAVVGSYASPGAGDSIMEQFDNTVPLDVTVLTFGDASGTYNWTIN